MIRTQDVFNINDQESLRKVALETYAHQRSFNPIYKQFCNLLKAPITLNNIEEIPYLPIGFFKTHKVITGQQKESVVFKSSGTTGNNTSKHYLNNIHWYQHSMFKQFEQTYGDPFNYNFYALLPHYLERGDSSLVYMVKGLMEKSNHNDNGFFLDDWDTLVQKLTQPTPRKIILFGVTYALLSLLENYNLNLENIIIIETGGMKGMRHEITRKELHTILTQGFQCNNIHSEYGMTELLSQAYCKDGERFYPPKWMHVTTRETNDPLQPQGYNQTGGLNIMDLANQESCAFIATQDLGRSYMDRSFSVLGRFDNSDVRGCNLMLTP